MNDAQIDEYVKLYKMGWDDATRAMEGLDKVKYDTLNKMGESMILELKETLKGTNSMSDTIIKSA